MNNKIKKNITIGIPAYNEEKNIKNLLSSIFAQNEENFILKEIIFISDGSTDETVLQVKKINDKRIKIINSKARLGKASRLNEIFDKARGDLIVLLDADIIIDSKNTLRDLIKPFESIEKLGLVGGNPHPIGGRTFIENAVNVTYHAYYPLRNNLREGSNPYGCDGKILALSKSFAISVNIPPHMIGVDSYLYFLCIKKGYVFKHAPLASVAYRSPKNLTDHILQSTRFMSAGRLHKEMFRQLFDKEYFVPKRIFYFLLFQQLLRKPLHSFVMFILNFYCRRLADIKFKDQRPIWEISSSTKEAIIYNE